MKIGFYTSTFNDRPVEEVFDFAAQAGFDAVEIDIGGHVKSPDYVAPVVEQARARGLFVSSVTLFGNQLDPDQAVRKRRREETRAYALAISSVEVPTFVMFPGRNHSASENDNYNDFAQHALSLLDGTGSLNIAFENWPGMDNDYIATTPSGWDQLFALASDDRFGVEFDPSHLIRLGIDPYQAFDGIKDRLKIVHGKDTRIDPVALQRVGYHGSAWWRYVLPGFGVVDWPRLLQQVRDTGFDEVISIEHEDSDFGSPQGNLELRQAGQREALKYLRQVVPPS